MIVAILVGLLWIYKFILLARVLLTWLPMAGIRVDPYHPAVQFLHQATEPVLAPLRSFSRLGTLDLSPLVAWFIIDFIQQILWGRSISEMIAFAIALVIAFSVHEFAHAFVAYRLGDPTAKHQGRLTLDPRKHLDILGSIMVLAAGFGWAKPVPVNPYYLRYGPKAGMAIVAAAGPLSNLILAIIAAIPIRLGVIENYYTSAYIPSPLQLFNVFIILNVVLLFFNLLPIAPLDGFKVVAGLLPYPTSQSFLRLEPLGPLILILLVFFGGPLFSALIFAPTQFVVNLLVG